MEVGGHRHHHRFHIQGQIGRGLCGTSSLLTAPANHDVGPALPHIRTLHAPQFVPVADLAAPEPPAI